MAYEMVMPYHLHMPSYFLETFTEYPSIVKILTTTGAYLYQHETGAGRAFVVGTPRPC